jgi:excisionase family DNA binding protein
MRLMKAEQAAELLQVSLQRIYELARVGLVPSVRIGRQVRFDEAALPYESG